MSDRANPEAVLREFEDTLLLAQTAEDLQKLRVTWLGRKEGRVTLLMKELGKATIEERRTLGPALQNLKTSVETSLDTKEKAFFSAATAQALEKDTYDITLPGPRIVPGRLHPLSQVMDEMVSVFRTLGFVVADGPEVESEFHNFEALNVPADHPARDMQDTFYIEKGVTQLSLPHVDDRAAQREPSLMRTHTSPVQVRIMEKYGAPCAVVVPGRVYRNEAQDATHSAIFHQMEGLLVDQNLSFADLKGTLAQFASRFFAPNVKTRFKPSYFPFTEPSAQVDVSCIICHGSGCRICKQTGWIELLGAGMVNPNVFRSVNIDPEVWTGFAFGIGIERVAMIRYGIDDIRLFYENDQRFLGQF